MLHGGRNRRARSLRTAGLVAAVGVFALLPLWGDTIPGSAVTHPEWARMILRGLDVLEDAGSGVSDTASLVFASLSGRDSRSWPADRYVRGNGIEVVQEEGTGLVRPTGTVGEAVYALAVARPGDYRLRFHMASPTPAEAEIALIGDVDVLRSFVVPAAPTMSWIDAGVVHLDAGAYNTSVLLPEGCTLEHVELAPPCVHPIEPQGGWKPAAIATTEDVAMTVLQALDMEYELPPAASPLEFRGSDVRLEDGSRAVQATDGPVSEGTFRGGPTGARVVLLADIPEPGLYALSVFGVAAGGQRWFADDCRKSVVCPSPDTLPQWRVILSGDFGRGPHVISATVGPNTVIERIRFERKKDTPSDYVGTVERLGLELGPEGPITREKAEEARRFLDRRRRQVQAELCGDILAPGTLLAELAAGAGGPGGTEAGGPAEGGGPSGAGGGGGGGGGGVPPPIIPPLPPGSPTLPLAFGG